MFGLEVVEILFFAGLAAQAAWVLRLWSLCLSGRYKGLVAYLTVTTVWGVAASLFRHLGPYLADASPGVWSSFAWFYVVTRPVIWVLFFVVLYECYDRMVAQYPGVRKAGRLTLYAAIAGAAGLFLWLTVSNPEEAGKPRYWYRIIVSNDESVYLGAAGAVLLLVLFRRFFSLPLPRNVGIIFTVFGAYFLGSGALYVAEILGPADGFGAGINLAGSALYLACLVVGFARFSPVGEDLSVDFRSTNRANAAATAQLAERRLQTINDQLVRALEA